MRGLTAEQKKAQLFKNGITAEDLKQEFKAGYEAGFQDASSTTLKTVYASVILALRRDPKLRFGKRRCRRVLREVDRIVLEQLSSQDAIDAAFQEVGLYLDFHDALDPIKEVAEE